MLSFKVLKYFQIPSLSSQVAISDRWHQDIRYGDFRIQKKFPINLQREI
jgi:hypothetical protein